MMRLLFIAVIGAALYGQAFNRLRIIPRQDDSAVGTLEFFEKYANGAHSTKLSAPNSLAASLTNTLPSAHPTASGQCLTSTTAGVWSWAGCGYTDYDVRSYGAVCDGVTDDTAAFASTIAAIGSNRGVVVLPPGVCLVTGITFTSSYQGMRGQGRDVSTLKSTTNSTIIDIPTVMTSAEFIAMDFADFTIKGNGGTSQIGIRAIGTGLIDYATIHRITFDDVYKGVVIAPSIHSSYVHIQDNLFVGSFNCIDRDTPGTGWIITGNAATMAAGGTCIYIHGSSGVGDIIVNSNHIEGGAVGIDFYCDATCTYGSRVVCNDNKIDTVSTAPIQAFNVTGSTFLGNRVIGGFAPVTFTGDNFDNIYDYDVSGIRFSDASSGHLTLHGGDFLIDGRGVGTQIHLSNTSTGGAYIFSSQDHQAWLMAGIEWDGTNFIPRATQASILRLSQGRMAFFGETGLTTGSPYVPALRWEIDSSNNWVPGADNSYSIGSTNMRPQVVYGKQGDFGGGVAGFYDAVNAKNTTVGAYGSCYVMSATDSVGATVYGAGRLCGRYTSNTFSNEEITIQTATGSGTYADAVTIVNDDVTIADTLSVTGNFSAAIVNATGNPAYRVGGTSIVDSSRNGSFVNLSASGTLGVTGVATFTGSIATGSDNTINIGSSGNKPIRVFTYGLSTYGSSYVTSGADFNIQSGGTFTAASGSTFNLSTTVTGNVSPATDGGGDLGTSSLKWGNAHINTADIYATIRPDTTNVRALGSSTRVWSKTWTNDIQMNGTVTAPSGNTGTAATLTCGAGQAVKNITVSGGIVTSVSCGTP